MMNIETVLQKLNAKDHGYYWIVKCPECGHHEAYIYKDDVKKHRDNPKFKIPIRCNRLNKCGKTSYLENVNIGEIPEEKTEKNIGIKERGIEKINCLSHLSRYLTGFDFDWRGISNQTLKDNGVIYLRKGLISFMRSCGNDVFDKRFFKSTYENRNLIFPIKSYNDECERLLLRSTMDLGEGKKEINMRLVKDSSEVWNRKDLISPDISTVFITEGIPDGLSVKEVNQNYGVVALPGVKKYRQLLKEINHNEIAMKKQYVLCFDNDEAGLKYAGKMIEQFEKKSISYECFNLHGYKDMNDFLQADRAGFFQTVKRYANKASFKIPAIPTMQTIKKETVKL